MRTCFVTPTFALARLVSQPGEQSMHEGYRFHALHALALCSLASLGCGNAGSGKGGVAPPDEIPETLQVAGGTVTLGFVDGRIREPVQLEPYAIMKHPVTQAQYDACVKAGGCEAVKEPACYMGGFDRFDMTSPERPAICVGYENAADYCSWVGGELPNLAQWMYAARGEQPQRYPWGDMPGTCEQHPMAMRAVEGGLGLTEIPVPCHLGDEEPFVLRVGANDSPADGRLQDALLTPAELVRGDASLAPVMCGSDDLQCMVYGRTAGAIDTVAAVTVAFPHAFRCTIEEN